MRRRAARLAVLAALAAGVVLSASPAGAHSSLIGSTPEDGAVLSEAPDEVVLEFDEQAQPDFSQVAVLDAEENHYEDGDPETEGATVTQAVTDLPAGDYRVSFRVGSSDGHPVTGVVAFTVERREDVGAADEPATDEEAADEEAADEPAGADGTEPASGSGSEDDEAAEDEDGTPMAPVVATVAAIAVVGVAGVLLLRRRPGTADDSPSGGQ